MSIPRVGHALKNWTKRTSISFVVKTVVNHKVVKTLIETIVDLCLQPMPPEKVNKKPEEQRSWKFFEIFMRSQTELNNNDEIYIGNKKYTIISKTAWEDAGYYAFEAVEDFIDTGSVTT
jgi:hypothetical protein